MIGRIESMEEFESLMSLIYDMNPDLTENEIDDRIYKGMQEIKIMDDK